MDLCVTSALVPSVSRGEIVGNGVWVMQLGLRPARLHGITLVLEDAVVLWSHSNPGTNKEGEMMMLK